MEDVAKTMADAMAEAVTCALALIHGDRVWREVDGDIHIDYTDAGGGWLDLERAAQRGRREEHARKYSWLALALDALELAGRLGTDEQAARTVKAGAREQWTMRMHRVIEIEGANG